MRLPDDCRFVPARAALRLLGGLVLAGLLAGCSNGGATGRLAGALTGPVNGPQADYPLVVGQPYEIAGVQFTPLDTMNYDEVGYLAAETATAGVTGAHHTLPLPSYVEVTSLDTGRTTLVRLERRGPMDSLAQLALSPAAMAQLGAEAGTPVRVRRVNPPEDHRAMLRAGEAAPLRMDTPMSLVAVLRRNLGAPPAAPAAAQSEAPMLVVGEADILSTLPQSATNGGTVAMSVAAEPLALVPETEPATEPATGPATGPASAPAPVASTGFMVQAAAFSTEERAQRVALALEAMVQQSGQFFRVRTGPFATRDEAEASLAKVLAAGYTDARILTSG